MEQKQHLLRQYASRVPCPRGLTMVCEMFPPLNLASRDIACPELGIDNKPAFWFYTRTETKYTNLFCTNIKRGTEKEFLPLFSTTLNNIHTMHTKQGT